jgi:hypothetical protein
MSASPISRIFFPAPFLARSALGNGIDRFSTPWRTVELRIVGDVAEAEVFATLANFALAYSCSAMDITTVASLRYWLERNLAVPAPLLIDAYTTAQGTLDAIGLLSFLRLEPRVFAGSLNAKLVTALKSSERKSELFALILRQSHFVTERCVSALAPAKHHRGAEIREFMAKFIQSETGHDVILAAAMRAVGAQPRDFPVLQETSDLLADLESAASNSVVELAFLLDAFENGGDPGVDQLPKLLETAGFAQAAVHIRRHTQINSDGQHNEVSKELLALAGPVEPKDAMRALAAYRQHFALRRKRQEQILKLSLSEQ